MNSSSYSEFTTVADVAALWRALFGGAIVREETLAEMLRQRGVSETGRGYGLGFWLLADGGAAMLQGGDPGVVFRSVHDPDRDATWTFVSNSGEGAREIAERLEQERTGNQSAPR